jgi:hypothetical protein
MQGMSLRHKKLAGLILFAPLTVLLVWRFLYSAEPVYNGRSLSAWAQQYGSNNWRGGGAPAAREAEAAIRQIGTNGIPFLLELMRVTDSGLKKKLRTIVSRSGHDPLSLKDTSSEIRRVGAHGLAALGTNAPPSTVPALIEIATHHPDEDGRYLAVFALRTLGVAAESAIPFFIQCLTNKESTIRDEAAIGMSCMSHRAEIVVPALIEYLKAAKSSPHRYECTDTIASLGRLGTNARAAAPILVELLKHSDPYVRSEITNWLPRIDAEAAAKAHIKASW